MTWLMGLAALGCTSIPSAADARLESTDALLGRGAEQSIAASIAVAPMAILVTDDKRVSARWVARRETIDGQLIDWLRRSEVFRRVTPLDPKSPASIDEQSWNRASELVLEGRLTGLRPRLAGVHWSYYPNLVNWLFWMIPAWYVAAEVYALDLTAEFSLRFVDDPEPLFKVRLSETVEGRFNEFDRGWRLAGLSMVMPSIFNTNEQWTRVSQKLYPAACSLLSQRLMAEIDQGFRETTLGLEYQSRARRDLALLIGLSRSADGSGAEDRASARVGVEAIERTLRAVGGSVRHVEALYDGQATAAGLRREIKEQLARRSRQYDRSVLFYAGRVELRGEALYLVPFDGAGASDKAISLSELGGMFSKAGGEKILFLECALPTLPSGVGLRKLLSPLTGRGINVMCAAGAGQGLVDGASGQGLFATHVANALSGKADADGDGSCSVEEIVEFVRRRVASDAGFLGEDQVPFVKYAS
jgi:hypothetical protein